MNTVQDLMEALVQAPPESPVYLCFKGMLAPADIVLYDFNSERVEIYNSTDMMTNEEGLYQ